MEFTLEGFFIATLGILPGFFLSLVKTIMNPEGEKAKIEEWLATSILASLGLNLIVAVLFVIFVIPIDLDGNVEHLVKQLHDQKFIVLLWYAGALYLAALVLGVASSVRADWRLGVLVYRWRLTPISPVPNVFIDTLEFAFRSSANLRLRGRRERWFLGSVFGGPRLRLLVASGAAA